MSLNRIAIFVDAGYLYVQGSAAVAVSKKSRSDIVLRESVLVNDLRELASEREPNAELLRIYWYDGLPSGGETAEQRRIAEASDVKCRYGQSVSTATRKAWTPLVTDLIELARARVIGSAIVLGGDEDLRIGIETAQRHGVRIHLLGIAPSRGSQSPTLRREADTTTDWDATKMAHSFEIMSSLRLPASANGIASSSVSSELPVHECLREAAASVARSMPGANIPELVANWNDRRGISPDVDSLLLVQARGRLRRELDRSEKRAVRNFLIEDLRALALMSVS